MRGYDCKKLTPVLSDTVPLHHLAREHIGFVPLILPNMQTTVLPRVTIVVSVQ